MASPKKTPAPRAALRRRSGPGGTVSAIAAIESLARAGRQGKAIAAANAALEAAPLRVQDRLALLDLRAESRMALGDFAAAGMDNDVTKLIRVDALVEALLREEQRP